MNAIKRQKMFSALNLLATLILAAGFAAPIFAHGGEDHGDAKPAVVSNQKGMIARTARAGEFEVLLKHSPVEPDTETAAKIFVTRFATNEPFADAQPTAEITAKDGKSFVVSAVKVVAPGSYSLTLPPLPAGDYTVLVALNAAGKAATATFSSVSVEPSEAASATVSGSWARTALMVLTAIIVLGSFGGLIIYAFRFARREPVNEETAAA